MEWFSKFKLPLALAIAGITFVSAGIYFSLYKNTKEEIKFSEGKTATSSGTIVVHIAGEVTNPGVYTMPFSSRVNDLLKIAGGLTENADKEFIDKSINLASPLKDGAKIYIPKAGETNTLGVSTSISINSSPLDELDKLPDIGQVRAQKIIDNRPYQTLEELVEKKVVGQSTFEKIKDKISLY